MWPLALSGWWLLFAYLCLCVIGAGLEGCAVSPSGRDIPIACSQIGPLAGSYEECRQLSHTRTSPPSLRRHEL
jgi:hypothetical protein